MSNFMYGDSLITIKMGDKTPNGYFNLDVTSRNTKLRNYLSPFFLGPVNTPDGMTANLVENLWQFGKVYPQLADENGNPTEEFFQWRYMGFSDNKAHRHTLPGKPLYHWWNGERLGYIESRKRVYIPVFTMAIMQRPDVIRQLKQYLEQGGKVAIRDFDGFNFKANGFDYESFVNYDKKILGHGHVIAMIMERPDLINYMLNRYNQELGNTNILDINSVL